MKKTIKNGEVMGENYERECRTEIRQCSDDKHIEVERGRNSVVFFRAKDLFTVTKMTGESCARNKFKVGRMWNFFVPHFISVNELLTEHLGILCNEGKLF